MRKLETTRGGKHLQKLEKAIRLIALAATEISQESRKNSTKRGFATNVAA
jgi:hypothetical protein